MRKVLIALSAASALLVLGAASAAQASTRVGPDATPACGNNCFNLYSLAFGRGQIQSANVPGDNGGTGWKVGQTVNLEYATDSSPNEDFTGGFVGTVAQLCPEGQLSPYICNTYGSTSTYKGNYPVYESDFSPYGNESGLCVGVQRPNTQNENVSLQWCGNGPGTFWVADLAHAHIGYTPFLNGADNSYTHPMVLTVATGKGIGRRLRISRLNTLTGGYIANEQMFALDFGIQL